MPAAPDPRRSRLVRGTATPALPPLPTLVVGVGGGVTGEEPGVQAMRMLATCCSGRSDLRFADAGALDAGLALDLEDGCDLIVIGEAKLGAPPCTVTLLAGAAADRLLAAPEYASPARTLCVLLHRLRQQGRLAARRAVLNVEPPPVALVHAPRAIAAAVARAAAETLALVEAWRLLDRVTRPRALRAAGGPDRGSGG